MCRESPGNIGGKFGLKSVSIFLAVGFLCGSLLGRAVFVHPEKTLPPSVAVTLLCLVAPTPMALTSTGFVLGILSSAVPGNFRQRERPPGIIGTVEGRVLSVNPGRIGGGVATILVDRVFLPRPAKARLKAHLRFHGGAMPFPGDRIRAPAHLIPFAGENRPDNCYFGNVDTAGWILLNKGGNLSQRRRNIRSSLQKAGRRFGPAVTGVLASIGLGDRSLLPDETSGAMRHAGVYHLLAVSGVHLAAALLLGYLFASPLGATIAGGGRPGMFLGAGMTTGGLLCIFYLSVTGLSPSASRAGIFAALAALALTFGRETSPLNILALCYLCIGAFSAVPQPGISLGLSMLACLGIFASFGGQAGSLRGSVKVSAGAFIFTLPLVALVFRGIPMLAPLLNLVVGIPFALVLIPGVVMGDVLSFAVPPLGNAVFSLCAIVGGLLTAFVSAVGKVRWIYLPLNGFGCGFAAAAGLACAILWVRWRGNIGRGLILLVFIFTAALTGNLFGDIFSLSRLAIRFPGLGQADAAILRTSGRTVMVDTGPPGAGLHSPSIARVMEREGIGRIDAIILTHPHPDHVGGAAFLMKHWDVGEVILPQTRAALHLWRKVLVSVPPGVTVRFLARGDSVRIGEMRFEAMAPFSDRYREGDDLNRLSLVTLLRWRDFSALFTGDAPWYSVEKIIGRLDRLDLLKVPHHGSAKGFDAAAMGRIARATGAFRKLSAVFTSGPPGERALPSLEVVRWFVRAGARFLLTGRGEGVNIIRRSPREGSVRRGGRVDIHNGI